MDEGRQLLTLIPSYADLPMEELYQRVDEPWTHEVRCREFGEGRAVFFNWDIFRAYQWTHARDHGILLKNALEWLYGGPSPVGLSNPGFYDVTLWDYPGARVLHLLNLNHPCVMDGSCHEVVPAPPQRLNVQWDGRAQVRDVSLLVSRKKADWRVSDDGGLVEVDLPGLEIHEVVVFHH